VTALFDSWNRSFQKSLIFVKMIKSLLS